jgi:hypothetical protein
MKRQHTTTIDLTSTRLEDDMSVQTGPATSHPIVFISHVPVKVAGEISRGDKKVMERLAKVGGCSVREIR